MNTQIASQRLDNQRITCPGSRRPEDLVSWFGAMQAQDYPAAKWALGLRMPDGATDAAIERAVNDGRLLRTHVMRPTWHFVAASDIHWMLELTAPRVQRTLAYAYRQNELDDATRVRAARVMEGALSGGQPLTRAELSAHLARARIMATGIRLALLTVHAELERVICSGTRRGKESTYTLLEKRAPHPKRLSREEALVELTTRYFRSHGPATLRDFVWWSGLTTADARLSLEMCRGEHDLIDGHMYWTVGRPRASETRRRPVYLLPTYDEYLVAYRDHDAVPRAKASSGILPQALVAGGQVAGTWKAILKGNTLVVDVATLRRLTRVERRALAETVTRYGRFMGRPVSINCAMGSSRAV